MRMRGSGWASTALLLVSVGCGSSTAATDDDGAGTQDGTDTTVPGDDATAGDPDGGSSDDGAPTPSALGRCSYESPFTGGAECRQYFGAGWTLAAIESECDGLSGAFAAAESCAADGTLGTCVLDEDPTQVTEILAYGDDVAGCAAQATGCEVFGGGTWMPAMICQGTDNPDPPPGGSVFVQPTLECRDALAGEPVGQTNGQVCTWQAISGCTEEGRRFSDYAACDVVRTQRPYYPAPPATLRPPSDPRLDDPSYAAELAWVTEQVQASACVCCHSEVETPNGPSNWYLEAPGNWMASFYDSGLAMSAGWVDSTAFGAYPAEENNGFHRDVVGLPSTDPPRMIAFFEGELSHRGLTPADFSDTKPFGGPLYDQLVYEPSPCDAGQGVASDGTIQWDGGSARYIYVLDAGSTSPTVPPNLDLPSGTRWRIDVPADGEPIATGEVVYGEVPAGTSQRFPTAGAPAALIADTDYYLYVSADVGIPVTRCLFRYPS